MEEGTSDTSLDLLHSKVRNLRDKLQARATRRLGGDDSSGSSSSSGGGASLQPLGPIGKDDREFTSPCASSSSRGSCRHSERKDANRSRTVSWVGQEQGHSGMASEQQQQQLQLQHPSEDRHLEYRRSLPGVSSSSGGSVPQGAYAEASRSPLKRGSRASEKAITSHRSYSRDTTSSGKDFCRSPLRRHGAEVHTVQHGSSTAGTCNTVPPAAAAASRSSERRHASSAVGVSSSSSSSTTMDNAGTNDGSNSSSSSSSSSACTAGSGTAGSVEREEGEISMSARSSAGTLAPRAAAEMPPGKKTGGGASSAAASEPQKEAEEHSARPLPEEDLFTPEVGSADELLLTPEATSEGVEAAASAGGPPAADSADGQQLSAAAACASETVYGPLPPAAAAAETVREEATAAAGAEATHLCLDSVEQDSNHVHQLLNAGGEEEEEEEDDEEDRHLKQSKVWSSLVYGCHSVSTYKRLNKISEGTYGAVFRAMDLKTKEIVALKQVKFHAKLWSEGFPVTSLREISILLELQHPNVVNVKQVVVGSGQHHVFMLLEALAYLHANFVFHRDVKPSNLLYSNRGVLKMADFGMARKFGVPFGHKRYTKEVVTLWYRPPEILLGQSVYSDKCDVWAVGAIFGELLLRRPLFAGHGDLDTLSKIWKLCGTQSEETWPGFNELPLVKSRALARMPHCQPTWREVFPPPSKHLTMGNSGVLSDLGLDLLQKLLTPDPAQRLSAAAALQHEYFKESPKPQPTELMPSYPDTNNQARRKRRRGGSADLNEQKHQDSFRFDARVDAEKFLSALDQKVRSQRKETVKPGREGL
ncbi:cyclin-dependent kinase G1 [Cyclospora cayetanensis]|uniref:Cyclin-dependent kinase 2 homolog n=1 Tax=Cyclospora cayetanensis TaxID=88456 RepID=A0A6P6S0T1_9EIME|nr:cyclin-dependent kinase G1 [Cyclospora cayetanensis]